MPLINFKLKHPDHIIPWGTPPDTSMHWFGLTDGEYWLELGNTRLFEYTDEILKHWGINNFNYVDYQVIRLIEDWTDIFQFIAEPIPDGFYVISNNHQALYGFYGKARNWLDQLSNDPMSDTGSYYDKYDQIIGWVQSRTLSTTHLKNGPGIHFFRNKDKLSIVWDASDQAEGQIPVWTSQTGEIEIEYKSFVAEVEDFGRRFFNSMDTQVQLALSKDWGSTYLDKEKLIAEHEQRKAAFQNSLFILNSNQTTNTDWSLISSLLSEMFQLLTK